ncbi:nuclear transport factor 2 family protein [Sphingobium boeckii]|uniref:Ketosteroid isomerase-like protein n=1 Tax=Sphingobium boeckii TaxID=1082345 RepID=A0A7W9AI77_9SPHN|nr:nuclear transport factor 2 family protein [Sphingobium boeckii]MBB5685929.1 ketosteroid isomerase-like protein [Sphingobium boeckii]
MPDTLSTDYAIRQLHARFVDAVWRKDANSFAHCFAEAGTWKIAGMQIGGRTEIETQFVRLLGACERVQLILGPPLLDLGEGTATGRIQVTELAKMADGSSAMTLGVYFDRYIEEGGQWYFAWRHWALHYRGPTDLSAAFVECPDYGPPPHLPDAAAPTFTRRVIAD